MLSFESGKLKERLPAWTNQSHAHEETAKLREAIRRLEWKKTTKLKTVPYHQIENRSTKT
jgi:hypothetical protein